MNNTEPNEPANHKTADSHSSGVPAPRQAELPLANAGDPTSNNVPPSGMDEALPSPVTDQPVKPRARAYRIAPAGDPGTDAGSKKDPNAPEHSSAKQNAVQVDDNSSIADRATPGCAIVPPPVNSGANPTVSRLTNKARKKLWAELTRDLKYEPTAQTAREKIAPYRSFFRKESKKGASWEDLCRLAAKPEIGAKVTKTTLRRYIAGSKRKSSKQSKSP